MTVGDSLIAFGLLAIVVVLTCEACWRARIPRWRGTRETNSEARRHSIRRP